HSEYGTYDSASLRPDCTSRPMSASTGANAGTDATVQCTKMPSFASSHHAGTRCARSRLSARSAIGQPETVDAATQLGRERAEGLSFDALRELNAVLHPEDDRVDPGDVERVAVRQEGRIHAELLAQRA